MKILKIILIVVVVIVAIPLVGALFVKGEFAVTRSITINKPKQDVFGYIVMLKNQNNFSKWAQMDPAMKKEYKGTDGTVGFVSAWESDNKDVGMGEQEIKKITDGERIDYELRFKKPMNVTNNAYMATEAVTPAQTKVTWSFNGKMPYPLNFMGVFMNMEELVGKDLEIGLNNLKGIMEK